MIFNINSFFFLTGCLIQQKMIFSNLSVCWFCVKLMSANKNDFFRSLFCNLQRHRVLLWFNRLFLSLSIFPFFLYWLLRLKMRVWQILTAGDFCIKTNKHRSHSITIKTKKDNYYFWKMKNESFSIVVLSQNNKMEIKNVSYLVFTLKTNMFINN